MGLCGSSATAHDKLSRQLDAANKADYEAELAKIKLLLLGAGESGKSTIFKQLRIIHKSKFSDEERIKGVAVVHYNTLQAMITLIEEGRKLHDAGGDNPCPAIVATEDADSLVAMKNSTTAVDAATGAAIATLWADPGIQGAYDRRAKFQLIDSAKYYFSNIARISAAGYKCTDQDLLRTRVRTSGVTRETYNLSDVIFEVYDVGGQRSERRKWMHCFDDVTAIIFVAAVSAYDQVLYEDATQNRIDEAVGLFDQIVGNRWFKETTIILFLNKRDLFEEKIKKVDIRDEEEGWFLDYEDGKCTCSGGYPSEEPCTCGVQDAAKQYLLNLFLSVDGLSEDRTLFHHITCATDTENVEAVFNACKFSILKKNMETSGFMDG